MLSLNLNSVLARSQSIVLVFDIFMSTIVFFGEGEKIKKETEKKKGSMFSVSRKGRFLLFDADSHGYNNEWSEVYNTGFWSIYSSKDIDLRLFEIKPQGKCQRILKTAD